MRLERTAAAAAAAALAISGIAVMSAVSAQAAPGPTSQPADPNPPRPDRIKVRWDWTMPATMRDLTTTAAPDYTPEPGADGIPDDPMNPVPGYPEAGNARYGPLPDDDRFLVVLDASRSSGAGPLRCTWRFDTEPRVVRRGTACRKPVRVRLPEGTHSMTLTVRDRNGSKTRADAITVKNVLMAITGDSYASGEGFPPFRSVVDGQVQIDWDEPACQRSRWSGFVRSALAVEESDPRSNVTLIDVACAGAQVEYAVQVGTSASGGMLWPQQKLAPNGIPGDYMPAQIDQLRKIAAGRPYDVTLLSIGGNDAGLAPIVKTCYVDDVILGKGNCYMEPPVGSSGKPFYQVVDESLDVLDDRYARLAPCFGAEGGAADCETVKLVSGQPANAPTPSKPMKLDQVSDLVQAMYPDLTQVSNGVGGLEPCNTGPPLESPLNQIDNTWAYGTLYTGTPGKKVYLPTNLPQYETPDPNPVVAGAYGLVPLLHQNRAKHGWSVGFSMYRASHPYGICAPGSWVYGFTNGQQQGVSNPSGLLHPNDTGQQEYADMLIPMSIRRAGLPVSR